MENEKIYCSHCGTQNDINSTFCYNCGEKLEKSNFTSSSNKETYTTQQKSTTKYKKSKNGLGVVGFVFCLIETITLGWLLVPLAWMIPLTIKVYNHVYKGEELTTGMKVVILLFVSLLGGLFLLLEDSEA